MERPPERAERCEDTPPAAAAPTVGGTRRSSRFMNRLAMVLVPVALVSLYLAFVHEPRRTGGQSGGSLNMSAIEEEHGEDAMDRTDAYAEPKAEPGTTKEPAKPVESRENVKPASPEAEPPAGEPKPLGESGRGG
ncbi:MAG: hypothetical protein AB7K52_07510 [Phycisphaerales bacterium]